MGAISQNSTLHESRADWTIAYPARNSRESWQADFVGVVHLSHPDKRYWVNLYLSDGKPVRLRLQEKGSLGHSVYSRLHPVPFGRFEGLLILADATFVVRLQPNRDPNTGLLRYRIHFEDRDL